MSHQAENFEFSERLNLAIRHTLKRSLTGPELATQFNLRYGNEPITPQAAYKWISGKGKPTNDKVDTLATWLNVSAHWLKFGPPCEGDIKLFSGVHALSASTNTASSLKTIEKEVLGLFSLLNERQQTLVVSMLKELAS